MTKSSTPIIKIITGSVRPGRFNVQPATWLLEVAQKRSDLKIELIDLAEVKLPFLDEAIPPSMGQYSQAHTKQWAATIDEADGFIFVTPEYNHSISPVLKNAVDFLFKEWHFKPLTFVSYGSLAGGSRAVEHWRGIAAELKMYDLREQVMLPNYWEHLDETGTYQFTPELEKTANGMLDSLVFWAKQMKAARKQLS